MLNKLVEANAASDGVDADELARPLGLDVAFGLRLRAPARAARAFA